MDRETPADVPPIDVPDDLSALEAVERRDVLAACKAALLLLLAERLARSAGRLAHRAGDHHTEALLMLGAVTCGRQARKAYEWAEEHATAPAAGAGRLTGQERHVPLGGDDLS